MEKPIKEGNVTCTCGKRMQVETRRDFVECIDCKNQIDVSDLPIKVEVIETVEEQPLEEGE